MSRFKLFGLMAAMMASIKSGSDDTAKEVATVGKQMRLEGNYGNPYFGGRLLNQRQRRKRNHQHKSGRKFIGGKKLRKAA